MKAKLFVTALGNWVMIEIAEMFRDGFQAMGVASEVVLDQLPVPKPPAGELQIIVAPHEFYPLFLEKRLDRGAIEALTRGAYLLTVEKPDTSWFDLAFAWAGMARGVIDINRSAVREMRDRGLEAFYAPLGYSRCLETGAEAGTEKSIDILFMGAHSPRRELFLSENAGFLAQHPCFLVLSRLYKPRLATTPGFFSGADRNRLLKASRILLNVRFLEGSGYLEWHRVMAAIANRCLVVTEPSEDLDPLIEGRHLVVAELSEMAGICREYLSAPDRLSEIVDGAYRFVTSEFPMAGSCRGILRHAGRPEA